MSAVDSAVGDFMQSFLNDLAGKTGDEAEAIASISFKSLPMAVTAFVAYQIYQLNFLGLLNNYNCNAVSVSQNLYEDDRFAGTATVSSIPATGQSLNAIFWWFPQDAKGNTISDYKKADRGVLKLYDSDFDIHVIMSIVKTCANGETMLEIVKPPPPPVQPRPGYGQAVVV
jgi:hypothetical protein